MLIVPMYFVHDNVLLNTSDDGKHQCENRRLSCFQILHTFSMLLQIPNKPAGIYLLRVSNGNTRAVCEIRSKLKIKTPEQCQ